MEPEKNIYGYQDYSLANCKLSLHKKDLWNEFHKLETEMIITKSGRRMFPAIRVQVEDLDPRAHYCIFLEMTLASQCRYKYTSALGWSPAGTEEAQSPRRLYVHPESPATGEHWMSQMITFGKLKLTNTLNPQNGQIVLSSMHKYQPKIVIMKSIDPQAFAFAPSVSFSFVETQFIAVTAYQNDKITKLKIDNNPFAKGFRENGQAKCKRKRNVENVESKEDDEEIDVITTTSTFSSSSTDSDQESVKVTPTPQTKNSPPRCPSTSPCCTSYYPYNYETYSQPFYGGGYYSYYTNVALCNSYYGNPLQYPYNKYYESPVVKKPKFTDFSIRAITGIS